MGAQHKQSVVDSLPFADGMVLTTKRETCAVGQCRARGLLAIAQRVQDGRPLCSHPKVYSLAGVRSADLLVERCTTYRALHYQSYAVGGDHLEPPNVQRHNSQLSLPFP